MVFGMWRSPVAHTAGGRVVAGSNPVIPTSLSKSYENHFVALFVFSNNFQTGFVGIWCLVGVFDILRKQ